MARLTEEKIQLIKETYAKVGTYSATAKIVGSSPATVKKYVTEDCPNSPKKEQVKFQGEILPVKEIYWIYNKNERCNLSLLSDEELKEIEELRREI
jgi:hypothetical protein